MARRGDPRGPSNAHVRVHVGGALVPRSPRSAKWGRLVRRFWPVFGTLEYLQEQWMRGGRQTLAKQHDMVAQLHLALNLTVPLGELLQRVSKRLEGRLREV